MEDVDPDTIWEQINHYNRPHNRYVGRMIVVLRRRVKIKVGVTIVSLFLFIHCEGEFAPHLKQTGENPRGERQGASNERQTSPLYE